MGRLRVLSGREVCRILEQHGFGKCGAAEVICANCGEEYVGEATTAHLLRTAEEVSRAGVEVDVREYVGP